MESITKGRYKYKIEQAVSDQTVDGLTGYGEHFGFYYKSDGRTIGELWIEGDILIYTLKLSLGGVETLQEVKSESKNIR